MAGNKNLNIADRVTQYDDEFIRSISLSHVKTNKDLKDLLSKLETANFVVTNFYQMLYNDYIISINGDGNLNTISIETIRKYKSLASKIQRSYNYINYMFTFDNPFKK